MNMKNTNTIKNPESNIKYKTIQIQIETAKSIITHNRYYLKYILTIAKFHEIQYNSTSS